MERNEQRSECDQQLAAIAMHARPLARVNAPAMHSQRPRAGQEQRVGSGEAGGAMGKAEAATIDKHGAICHGACAGPCNLEVAA